ncbi:hypothetical protein ACVWWR_007807 [Bradyrhizobium sp. LM3.2]
MRDLCVVDDQREALDQREACDLHGRQIQGARERQLLVRQHRERQMQPRGHLGLVRVALGREAEHLRGAGGLQFGEQIAKRAGLRRATAGAGNHVPIVDERDFAGLAGAWIGEHHGATGERRQRHRSVVGREQADRGQRHAFQMRRAAVICGGGNPAPVDLKQVFLSHLASPSPAAGGPSPGSSRASSRFRAYRAASCPLRPRVAIWPDRAR